LEESEFGLPFVVGEEERERGARGGRVVSFRDEVYLPVLDTSISQGLAIEWAEMGLGGVEEDGVEGGEVELGEEEGESAFEFGMVLEIETGSMEEESDGSLVSEGSTVESLESGVSTADSAWTAFSEEADGIEMFF
jgi:hypothetical protein